jgi:AICAR transformylase/IMP cyclohydrolase PurH
MKREFAGAGRQQLDLRYGMNPHQKPAEVATGLDGKGRDMPIKSRIIVFWPLDFI